MERQFIVTFSVSVLCLVALPVLADESATISSDPSGTWHWEQDYGNGPVKNWLILKADGDKLTGNYLREDSKHPLIEGKVEDGKFSFKLAFQNEKNNKPIDVTCNGSVSDHELSGTSSIVYKGNTTELELKAKRATRASDLVGTWTLQIDAEGRQYTPKVLVTRKDDQLAAKYATADFGTFDVKEITIKDNKLRFTVFAESDQGKLDLKYEGVPRGDLIAGTLHYEVGSASGSADFTGKRTESPEAK